MRRAGWHVLLVLGISVVSLLWNHRSTLHVELSLALLDLVVAANGTIDDHDVVCPGSYRTSPRPGIEVFHYVCLKQDTWQMYSYGSNMEHPRKDTENIVIWQRPIRDPINKSLQEWSVDTKNSTLVEEETVLLMEWFDNIAHVLSDTVFGLIQGDANVTTTPYTSYVRGAFWPRKQEFLNDCPSESWSCNLFMQAGLVPKNKQPVFHHPNSSNKEMICFENLVVPKAVEFRFEPDPDAVQTLHRKLTDSLPHVLDNQGADGPVVLLYDRKGSKRRVYNNSDDLVSYLTGKFQVVIHKMGEEWNDLSANAQAALYNSHSYIIAPHGAHLANLINSKAGTKVIEIQCETDMSTPKQVRPLQKKNLTTATKYRNDNLDWYGASHPGDQRWFVSFSPLIGIEHFVYREKEGCAVNKEGTSDLELRSDYTPPVINLDPVEFGKYVASRLNLKKK